MKDGCSVHLHESGTEKARIFQPPVIATAPPNAILGAESNIRRIRLGRRS
jgi:hypothetical protein